jgi:hypothetical protein
MEQGWGLPQMQKRQWRPLHHEALVSRRGAANRDLASERDKDMKLVIIGLGLYFAVSFYPQVRAGFDFLRYDVTHIGKAIWRGIERMRRLTERRAPRCCWIEHARHRLPRPRGGAFSLPWRRHLSVEVL